MIWDNLKIAIYMILIYSKAKSPPFLWTRTGMPPAKTRLSSAPRMVKPIFLIGGRIRTGEGIGVRKWKGWPWKRAKKDQHFHLSQSGWSLGALIDGPVIHFLKGRITLKNDEFSEKFQTAFDPHFRKIMLRFFSGLHDRRTVYNGKNLQHKFLEWKWPPPPFGTFPKIHPFWLGHPSLIAAPRDKIQDKHFQV